MKYLRYFSSLAAMLLLGSPSFAGDAADSNLGLNFGHKVTFNTSDTLAQFFSALQSDVSQSANGVTQVLSAFQSLTSTTLQTGNTVKIDGVNGTWTGTVTFGSSGVTFISGVIDASVTNYVGSTPLPPSGGSAQINQAPGPIAGSGLGALALIGFVAVMLRRRQTGAAFSTACV